MTNDVGISRLSMIITITVITLGVWNVECISSKVAKDIRICTSVVAKESPVVVDRFYANTLNIKHCICVANIVPQLSSTKKLTFQDTNRVYSIPDVTDCGSRVIIIQTSNQRQTQSCHIEGYISIFSEHTKIDFLLFEKPIYGNGSYCFKLGVDSNYFLHLSCIASGEKHSSTVGVANSKSASHKSPNIETVSKVRSLKGVSSEFVDNIMHILTSTQQSETKASNSNADVANKIISADKEVLDKTTILIYVGIGFGLGIGLVITVVCLVKYSRTSIRSSRESRKQDDVNDFGVKYTK